MGEIVHMKYREDKASSLELSTIMPYHPFSWDEGNLVENVYHNMSTSVSSSIWNNRESSCSSVPLVNIFYSSGFHHCLEDLSYTTMGTSSCISFNSTSPSQVDGCLKYDPQEAYQDNEALRYTPMVMLSPRSLGLSFGVNKFTSIVTLSPSTLHMNSMHGSQSICYFLLNSLHKFYGSNGSFHDRFEAWLEESYSSNVPMNYCIDIFNMVNGFDHALIFPNFTLFLFQILFLIFYDEHACASLGLYRWLHWHYEFT
jgi:hypothetical protein